MKKINKRTGFTLIEVLFSSVVMLAGTSLLVSLSVNVAHFESEEQMQNKIERETSLFLDYLDRDIKSAVGVIADFPASSWDYGSTVTLKMPEFDESGMSVADTYDYVFYEYNYQDQATYRTVYDDAEGSVEKTRIKIPAGRCSFMAYADDQPLYSLQGEIEADAVQLSVYVYDDVRQDYYVRWFDVASTFRNPS